MAIRHSDWVSALILLILLAYKPPSAANSAASMAQWLEKIMMTAVGSDFLFCYGPHLTRGWIIRNILATPPERLDQASLREQAHTAVMLDTILPVSARAA